MAEGTTPIDHQLVKETTPINDHQPLINEIDEALEDELVVETTGVASTTDQPWFNTSAKKTRALIAFWIFGLCNNFGYVVMLSAAYDILQPAESVNKCSLNETIQSPHHLICNKAGTGDILLADILPTMLIKFTAPFYMHRISYNLRMTLIIFFNAGSFIIVALAGPQVEWLSFIGVVCASISSGFGEINFLSLSSYYPSNSIATYASGTGAAGIFGAVIYSGLTQLGISPANTLYIMLIVPVCQALSYFVLLVKPPNIQSSWSLWSFNKVPEYSLLSEDVHEAQTPHPTPPQKKNDYTLLQMIKLVKPLLKFMIPLMIVYMAEYFINQALFELLYFSASCSWLTISAQYRWYQTIYQVGVFISRSSVIFFKLKVLWILPILQVCNVAILSTQVVYHYMPEQHGIWIVFAFILYEGLLGGLGYVHTFYQISQQVKEEHKEFSMGIASVADTTGIVISAFISILAHNRICNLGVTWT